MRLAPASDPEEIQQHFIRMTAVWSNRWMSEPARVMCFGPTCACGPTLVHAGGAVHNRGRDLLRKPRSELGTRGHDQGPAGRRGQLARRNFLNYFSRLSGGGISICGDRGHSIDQAPDLRPQGGQHGCGGGHNIKLGRGGHSRSRVFRSDPAAHLGRARPGAADSANRPPSGAWWRPNASSPRSPRT